MERTRDDILFEFVTSERQPFDVFMACEHVDDPYVIMMAYRMGVKFSQIPHPTANMVILWLRYILREDYEDFFDSLPIELKLDAQVQQSMISLNVASEIFIEKFKNIGLCEEALVEMMVQQDKFPNFVPFEMMQLSNVRKLIFAALLKPNRQLASRIKETLVELSSITLNETLLLMGDMEDNPSHMLSLYNNCQFRENAVIRLIMCLEFTGDNTRLTRALESVQPLSKIERIAVNVRVSDNVDEKDEYIGKLYILLTNSESLEKMDKFYDLLPEDLKNDQDIHLCIFKWARLDHYSHWIKKIVNISDEVKIFCIRMSPKTIFEFDMSNDSLRFTSIFIYMIRIREFSLTGFFRMPLSFYDVILVLKNTQLNHIRSIMGAFPQRLMSRQMVRFWLYNMDNFEEGADFVLSIHKNFTPLSEHEKLMISLNT